MKKQHLLTGNEATQKSERGKRKCFVSRLLFSPTYSLFYHQISGSPKKLSVWPLISQPYHFGFMKEPFLTELSLKRPCFKSSFPECILATQEVRVSSPKTICIDHCGCNFHFDMKSGSLGVIFQAALGWFWWSRCTLRGATTEEGLAFVLRTQFYSLLEWS